MIESPMYAYCNAVEESPGAFIVFFVSNPELYLLLEKSTKDSKNVLQRNENLSL